MADRQVMGCTIWPSSSGSSKPTMIRIPAILATGFYSLRLDVTLCPRSPATKNGVLAPAGTVLDMKVSVEPGSRMPSEHPSALCTAMTKASGVRVIDGGQWFDQFHAPNNLVPPRFAERLLSRAEKQPYSMMWGD